MSSKVQMWSVIPACAKIGVSYFSEQWPDFKIRSEYRLQAARNRVTAEHQTPNQDTTRFRFGLTIRGRAVKSSA